MRIAFYGNFGVDYTSESHHTKSLEDLGHDVVRLQEPRCTSAHIADIACQSDLFVWVHTHGWDTPGMDEAIALIKRAGVPVITYHLDLYMPIGRWRQYENSPYMRALDHFFTVDPRMADWLNDHTDVCGHFLPAGVYGRECYISDQPSEHANDVIFVGSKGYHPEWPWRRQLIDWLRSTYGSRFTHVGGDGDTGTLRGDGLNRCYANSKVAVGDTLCVGFNYPGYVSDRLFEASGRGGAQVFPRIVGVDEWFKDGEHLRFFNFGDFDDLKAKIDWMLEHDDEREGIRRAGHELVKSCGTYRHRWETILDTVFG